MTNASEISLLGHSGKLEIKREDKMALIEVPDSFDEDSFGVLVFRVEM